MAEYGQLKHWFFFGVGFQYGTRTQVMRYGIYLLILFLIDKKRFHNSV